MKITEEKVWMKHYPDAVREWSLPECTALNYMKLLNAERLNSPALHYYGKDISFQELFHRINETANALL